MDGQMYIGEWENDLQHGHGCLIKKNGYKFEGEWVNGKPSYQNAKVTLPNGTFYSGDFKNEKKHGEGEEIQPNGANYKGQY